MLNFKLTSYSHNQIFYLISEIYEIPDFTLKHSVFAISMKKFRKFYLH